MRVAYICADPGVPVFGMKGCSIHIQEVIRALIRRGAQVHLFASRTQGESPIGLETVCIHRLPALRKGEQAARERAAFKANDPLRTMLQREGPFDLVYERYALWSFAGMEYARTIGVPSVLEVNAPLIEEQAKHRSLVDRSTAKMVALRVFGAAKTLVAVSQGVATYLVRHPGVGRKVHVVPNGVNPDRFPETLKPSRPACPGTFTVGFVGTLKPWHDLLTLVEAFAMLHQRYSNSRLLIVGDGPEREGMMKVLADSSLAESSEFTGAVPPSEIPGLLASMDVAVAPYSKLEPFYFSPLKVYEYMAAGLPVVTNPSGQLAELIQDGMNGLLVPPDDPDAMAEAFDRLRCEPDLRNLLGQTARTTVLRRHTWDVVVNRILDWSNLRMTPQPRCVKEI